MQKGLAGLEVFDGNADDPWMFLYQGKDSLREALSPDFRLVHKQADQERTCHENHSIATS
jgi:hypothetical protein